MGVSPEAPTHAVSTSGGTPIPTVRRTFVVFDYLVLEPREISHKKIAVIIQYREFLGSNLFLNILFKTFCPVFVSNSG